jgi:hypothetical protein
MPVCSPREWDSGEVHRALRPATPVPLSFRGGTKPNDAIQAKLDKEPGHFAQPDPIPATAEGLRGGVCRPHPQLHTKGRYPPTRRESFLGARQICVVVFTYIASPTIPFGGDSKGAPLQQESPLTQILPQGSLYDCGEGGGRFLSLPIAVYRLRQVIRKCHRCAFHKTHFSTNW